MTDEIPNLLSGLVPHDGDIWLWEPEKEHAREFVRVTDVRWNGEEVWVESEVMSTSRTALNDLSRWVEATVLVRVSEREQP